MVKLSVPEEPKRKGSPDEDYVPTGRAPPAKRPAPPKPKSQPAAIPATVPRTGPLIKRAKAPEVKRKPTVTEKGKSKVGPSPMDKRPRTPSPASSDTESDSIEAELDRAVVAATKAAHIRKKPRTGNASSVPSSESNLPFLDGNLNEGLDQQKYEESFREKQFCPVVSVNFQALKNDSDLNLDLSELLGHYECWLKVDEEFCPEVVRKFYCNMCKTDKDDEPEVVRTRLRGREIVLTREKLNEILEAPQVSSEPLLPLTPAEA